MCLESQRLDEQINSLLSQISYFPDGKLICAKDRNHTYKWYRSDGHQSVYIPKKERKLAEQLAIKRYLLLQLEDLQNEKRAIDFYLRHHSSSKAEEMLSNMSEYRTLLLPHFKPKSELISEWLNSDYESNPKFPEQKIHNVTGEIFYWEHFGMMDNSKYAKHAGEKLQLYMNHGIIPSINLITTYETLKQPLSYEDVEKIVLEKFLN